MARAKIRIDLTHSRIFQLCRTSQYPVWYDIESYLQRIAAVPLIKIALGALISPFECSLLVLIDLRRKACLPRTWR